MANRSASPMTEPDRPESDRATARDGAFVELTRVQRHETQPEELHGAYVNARQGVPAASGFGFNLVGWVVGQSRPAACVEVHCRGVRIVRAGVNRRRDDIRTMYAGVAWAGNAGFSVGINAVRLPSRFALEITAVLTDGHRVRLASIEGRRRLPDAGVDDHMQPVALTTMGRSGSTWATRLLGQHPAITTFQPFEYETRAAAYWLGMLGSLSEPASFTQMLQGIIYGEDWWVGSQKPAEFPPPEAEMECWLGSRQVEELLPFCTRQIEGFYRHAAEMQGELDSGYFCEKVSSHSFVPLLLEDLYPRAREVILVRDFRDVMRSMMAYNERRGFRAFGPEGTDSEEEFIRWWRPGAEQLLNVWRARSDSAHLLRYEDLILKPEETLTSLFEYVGVDSDRETVQGLLDRAHSLTPDRQKRHQTSGGPAQSIGRWRRDWDERLQRVATDTFGDILEGLGYDPKSSEVKAAV
jgi:hypothetical protein